MPTILFYPVNVRSLRTTLIGNLFEIAQVYPVILLTEPLDKETEALVHDKSLFPKLGEIVVVNQYGNPKITPLRKNRYLWALAKKIIEEYKPDFVIGTSDMHSLFEMYLMRFSKKAGAINIVLQAGVQVIETSKSALWVDLVHVHSMPMLPLPLSIKSFLVKIRKHLGHFLYYWLLPVLVGEKPFKGKGSYILREGNAGVRDAHYSIVFSENERIVFMKDGVPAEKLHILNHPLQRQLRSFFKNTLLNFGGYNKSNKKNVLVLVPSELLGFRQEDHALLSAQHRLNGRIRIIQIIDDILKDWEIIVKPHPDTKKEEIEPIVSISKRIQITSPCEPADKFIELSDLIIGLPRSASTVIFTANLQCPDKPIISLDLDHEFTGDIFKGSSGIEYIKDEQTFVSILKQINNGNYVKKIIFKPDIDGFEDTVSMLRHLSTLESAKNE
jgi:hypothetical protein